MAWEPWAWARPGAALVLALTVAAVIPDQLAQGLWITRGVELAQRAGCAVAWVGEGLFVVGQRPGVVAVERGLGHEHFAAHFQNFGCRPTQTQSNRLDGAQIDRDILAGCTITACGALHENAVFVSQTYRQAIQLRFDGKGRRFDTQGVVYAFYEVENFIVAESIVQRQHWNFMLHLREFPQRCRAYTLGWRIGRNEFGVLFLKRFKLSDQQIVFEIGDLRLVEHVVLIVRIFNQFP